MTGKAKPKRKMSYRDLKNPFKDLAGGGFLYEARDKLWLTFSEGESQSCPCCGQEVKCYPRSISAANVRLLARLALAGPTSGRDMRRKLNASGDYNFFRFFDIAEQDSDDCWRITDKGLAFLRGQTKIPKYIYVFDNVAWGESIDSVSVNECDEEFSLPELLNPETGADKEIT